MASQKGVSYLARVRGIEISCDDMQQPRMLRLPQNL
jgi:hypothetical protein